jgi:hypothetical protein
MKFSLPARDKNARTPASESHIGIVAAVLSPWRVGERTKAGGPTAPLSREPTPSFVRPNSAVPRQMT